jgi:phosphohistidine phosphatase
MLLTLLRHARAEPSRSEFDDAQRALDPAGRREAEEVARRLQTLALAPSLILASPALRASETALIFARILSSPPPVHDGRLYLAGADRLLEIMHEHGGTASHLMIVGHNPGISTFADRLSADRPIGMLPTSAACTLRFEIGNWAELEWRTGTTVELDYPGSAG